MENVKENKNSFFSKIKDFFNNFLGEDIDDIENVDLNKDLQESIGNIEGIEKKYSETVVVKNPKKQSSQIKDVKISEKTEETLDKMRAKLNQEQKSEKKSEGKEIGD